MRSLKFRAWDKENEEYMNGYEVLLKYDGLVISRYALVVFDTDMPVNVIIEQYTGLKDKNGKEIYEGDIVRWSYRIDRHCEKQYDNLVVKWSSGKNEYYPCSTESGFSLPESEDGYDVIGNIHENPELVEGEK